MNEFDEIPSCSFYGRSKCKLPPPPAVSDHSDISDDEENMTLDKIRKKLLQNRNHQIGKLFQ